jgi:hypothetical protein
MEHTNVWHNAKDIQIQTSQEIAGGFSLGFDDKLPEETKAALTDFAYWVEDHYPMPVTLWVDFKYNHYLLDECKQRVPYKFYWVDFENYPVFLKEEDIPVIELAAREEPINTVSYSCVRSSPALWERWSNQTSPFGSGLR